MLKLELAHQDTFKKNLTRMCNLINITHLKGNKFYLNPEMIQTIEATPDTVITLENNKILVVRESPEEICEMYLDYRRKISTGFDPAAKQKKPK